jgi:hypothetical protein
MGTCPVESFGGWGVAMPTSEKELGIVLVDDDLDDEEVDELTQQLREELLESDVDSVELVTAGEAPPGTRGLEILVIGGLLVKVAESVDALSTVIGTIRHWLSRRGRGKIKIQLGDDVLELSSVSKADQERLVDAFLNRHARS